MERVTSIRVRDEGGLEVEFATSWPRKRLKPRATPFGVRAQSTSFRRQSRAQEGTWLR